MTTNYRRGADFERKVRTYFTKRGFVVFRSSGSRGPCDLVALKAEEVTLIQCRKNGRMNQAERDSLAIVGHELGCRVFLAWQGEKGIRLEELEATKEEELRSEREPSWSEKTRR